jgi:hypothetical protein
VGKRSQPAEPAYEACIARVRRADMHLKALQTRLTRFRKDDPYEIVSEPNTDSFPPEVIIYGRALKDPPTEAASFVIGDIVNNLRAALDNLVWALSVKASPSPPPKDPIPKGDLWRKVAFPVVIHKTRWNDACVTALRFVDPALHARFYRLQPFYRRKKKPWRDPLAVLDELWNIDKHRHLHVTHAFLGLEYVLSTYPLKIVAEAPPGYADALKHSYSIVSQRRPGPVKGKTELGRVIEPGLPLAPDVYMHTYIAFDIAFEQRSPANGGLVIPTLRELRNEVRSVVESFRADL